MMDNTPGRKSKVMSLESAIAKVDDGMTLGIGGLHNNNSPMALTREVVRKGIKNLHIVPNVSAGLPVDLLIGAGAATSTVVCYIGLEDLGLARNFRRAVEEGQLAIEEGDEPYLIGGLTAGAADQPFFAMPKGHAALDNAKLNDRFQKTTDPFSGEEIYVTPALQPDVALIHVQQADAYGNCRILGSVVGDYLLARASTKVVVSAEEIISSEEIRSRPQKTTVPGFMVDAVVWAPYGAHPNSCHARYLADEAAMIEYRDNPVEAYIANHVADRDHWAYLEDYSVSRLLKLRQDTELFLADEGTQEPEREDT